MLKHNDIISVLTPAQKVRMLTDAGNLSGKDMKILGIGMINEGDMKDYGRGLYPNVTALAHSWDKSIWYGVAKAKAEMILDDGKNFVITPGSKIKISPYRREISEDPYLASAISSEHAKATDDLGVISAASGFYLTKSDTAWLDKEPDKRVISEFVLSPFRKSLKDGRVNAVITDARDIGEKYEKISEFLQNGISKYADFLICKKATDENTVDFVSRGIICLEGSSVALESAIARYKKLKKSIENNEGITNEQLQDELKQCTAISMETVDAALDKLIDFVYTVNKNAAAENMDRKDSSDLMLRSTLASAVLLKNVEYALPLEENEKIGIIGDIAFKDISGATIVDKLQTALAKRGYECVGAERGYDMDLPHSNTMHESAIRLLSKCDTVLLFLGFGYEAEKRIPKTETLSLPANQLCLAQKLIGKGARVVAVISSGHAPDIAFTRDFDAVLLMPLEVEKSADALSLILSGDYCPSGKLAYTLYSGSDGAFLKAKTYRGKYEIPQGPFIGYRYYDTARLTVGYPFGHGLSYVNFKYSDLEVSRLSVSFTVENRGRVPATEVAQVYIGYENSPVIRAEKELCGFAKIELMPKEKKTVRIPLSVPEIWVDGKFIIAEGNYCVSVGSSSADIRLKSSISVSGITLTADKKKRSDYLQSFSNVREDNYTLEASYSFMKKSIKNIIFGIAFIILAISTAVFNSVTKHPAMFVGVLSGILAVIAIVFFLLEVLERNRLYKQERASIDSANEAFFANAEEITGLSTAKMFKEEFETDEHESGAAIAEVFDEFDELGIQEYINKEFFFADAVSEFKSFLASRGYKLNAGVSESLLASIATSRLILTGGMDSEQFSGFARAFSEYFGAEAFVDTVSKKKDGDNSFYSYDYHGDHTKKNILLALESARSNPSKLVIAYLDGASVSDIEEYIAPFLKYLYSPKTNNRITVKNENGAMVDYNIAPNFRLFINVSAKVSLDILPMHIASLIAVNRVEYVKCQIDESFAGVRELNRYQLDYMRDKESMKAEISEDTWKKVDKLEKYAAKFSDYRIGNKLWLSFEKHIGLLMAAKLDVSEALDLTMAARLVSSVAVAVKDKIGEEDQNLIESLEFIFGEEKVDNSKNLINSMIFEVPEEAEEAAVEEPSEKAEEAAAEEPSEKAEEAAVEGPSEKTEEAAVEGPSEKTEEAVAEEPTEKAAEAAVEEPAEKAEEVAVEEPAEKAEEAAAEEPPEKAEEAAVEEPAEKAEEAAVEEPNEKTEEAVTEDSKEQSSESDEK